MIPSSVKPHTLNVILVTYSKHTESKNVIRSNLKNIINDSYLFYEINWIIISRLTVFPVLIEKSCHTFDNLFLSVEGNTQFEYKYILFNNK